MQIPLDDISFASVLRSALVQWNAQLDRAILYPDPAAYLEARSALTRIRRIIDQRGITIPEDTR